MTLTPTRTPTVTPTPSPSVACCGNAAGEGSYAGTDLYVYPNTYICSTFTNTAILWVSALDRPNRFSIYDSSGQVTSSGWVGIANYPGPWGASLNVVTPISIPFTWNSSTDRYVSVEAGNGSISDAYEWILSCDYSVGFFSYGADCAAACGGTPNIQLYSSCSATYFGPGCDVRSSTGQEPTPGYYASGGYCYFISSSEYEPVATDSVFGGGTVTIPPSDYTIVISKTICPSVTPTPTITPTRTPSPSVTPAAATPSITPTVTRTPSITPSPTRSTLYIKGTSCTDPVNDVRSFSYSGGLQDGDVIQINSGANIGCYTMSTFKPGVGTNGNIDGLYTIIGDCLNCTI
jgi:hypothetical protein